MRLITTGTLVPEFLNVYETPDSYAILSHTWSPDADNELTFQDLQALITQGSPSDNRERIKAKSGLSKVKKARRWAGDRDNNRYVSSHIWIDTCCINKESSVELDESIRSMFKWYERSTVCYIYLSDVKPASEEDPLSEASSFSKSRWFTRGWTLQELLAPRRLQFLDCKWSILGEIDKYLATSGVVGDSFVRKVAEITGIDENILTGQCALKDVSLSTRMRWASKRKTSRSEDMAYCLMGVFNINMNMRYGEGGVAAFHRLQQEIMMNTNDHTLFAWKDPSCSSDLMHGILADSPCQFQESIDFQPYYTSDTKARPYKMTNCGLEIELHIDDSECDQGEYIAYLECVEERNLIVHFLKLRLRRLNIQQFARIEVNHLSLEPWGQKAHQGEYKTVFIRQTPINILPRFTVYEKIMRTDGRVDGHYAFEEIYPRDYWNSPHFQPNSTSFSRPLGLFRFLHTTHSHRERGVDVIVGLEQDNRGLWRPWYLHQQSSEETAQTIFQRASRELGRLAIFPVSTKSQDPIDLNDRLFTRGWSSGSLNKEPNVLLVESKQEGNCAYTILLFEKTELDVSRQQQKIKQLYRYFCLPGSKTLPEELFSEGAGSLRNYLSMKASFELFEYEGFESLFAFRLMRKGLDLVSLASWIDSLVNPVKIKARSGLSPLLPDWSKFLEGCRDGDENLITKLLRRHEGEPYKARLLECQTEGFLNFRPLHWATVKGHRRIVSILIREGASAHNKTTCGWTTLHLAAMKGDFSMLRLILYELKIQQWGICTSVRLTSARIPLSYISGKPLERSFRRAASCEQLDSSGDAFWYHCAINGRKILPSDIPETGNFPKKAHPQLVNDTDIFGRSVLWHAALGGSPEIIRLLIRMGAIVERKDGDGVGPLHIACREGNTKAVRALLKLNASPNARTYELGLVPAHYAEIFGHLDVLSMLQEAGSETKAGISMYGVYWEPSRFIERLQRDLSIRVCDQTDLALVKGFESSGTLICPLSWN